jgi:magnesium transporter
VDRSLEQVLKQVLVLIRENREDELKVLLEPIHPADLAELLEELPDEQQAFVVRTLGAEQAALALGELEPQDQAAILSAVGEEQAGDILTEMSPDDVADLVRDLPKQQAGELLELLEHEDATEVRDLLEYSHDTAGGLMTTEFFSLSEEITAAETIELLRRLAPAAETPYYLYVVNERRQLVGVVSLRDLITSPPARPIREFMRESLITVQADDDQEDVARVVSKYNLLAVPVIDQDRTLLGIVTVDDVIDVIHQEATEDIYKLAGAAEHRIEAVTPWEKAKRRLPWLIPVFCGEILASLVIDNYSGVMTQFVVLAAFVPVVMGMGGSAATQALAVSVRGLATGEVDVSDIWASVWREVRAGMIIGLFWGLTALAVSLLWKGSLGLGLIVGIALLMDVTVATLLGSLFPFLLERFKIDPAIASGPFVTTLLDVVGMLIYMSTAATLIFLL